MKKQFVYCCPFFIVIFLWGSFYSTIVKAEDGYDLWLRYAPLSKESQSSFLPSLQSFYQHENISTTEHIAREEFQKGILSLFNTRLNSSLEIQEGMVVIATIDELLQDVQFDNIKGLLEPQLLQAGDEGFVLRQLIWQEKEIIILTANQEIGLLYGTFDLLQFFQTNDSIESLNTVSSPKIELRLLNHWDNLDRSVERGYAGQSIWDWWRLPDFKDQRYIDYARANASIGINGTVLNNVNAKSDSLTAPYLEKAAAVADILRPYGIKVYLSARFSSPIEIGGLESSDPLDPKVQAWWNAKALEIYQVIPDFGGFLVKANSEGQPGPQDYGRSHAEGANMLAAALEPYGGVVMWRAFVYSDVDPEDRAKQAFSEFKPLDGQFADNVIIQVKNGPIDFQPREPFHPMFGAFPKTPLMLEFQITKEYLGFATHLAYLGPLYEEVLSADTYQMGEGSLVSKVVDGSLHGYSRTGIAGVANIGSDRDWSGSDFNQANWYVFGRLAWNPELSSQAIAQDWLSMTFSADAGFVKVASQIMMSSREAIVDYMTPLGLAHLMDTGHHYGPGPWVSTLSRPEWNPVYYHQADSEGIGFDRTEQGSEAIAQYSEEVASRFADLDKVNENLLLWFHHVPWSYQMSNGNTLWQELVNHYDKGVSEVEAMISMWKQLESYVDPQRFNKATTLFNIQLSEAKWWRDASLAYFMSVSKLELPTGSSLPEHSLEYYQSQSFPYAPGR